jgi:hypothetical protein
VPVKYKAKARYLPIFVGGPDPATRAPFGEMAASILTAAVERDSSTVNAEFYGDKSCEHAM